MTLAPLGIELPVEVHGWAGFGKSGEAAFWIGPRTSAQTPMHIAFAAETRAQARAFHQAALLAGATDNGPPGVREIYHPHYYGAFVIGPDGQHIEAICRAPEI